LCQSFLAFAVINLQIKLEKLHIIIVTLTMIFQVLNTFTDLVLNLPESNGSTQLKKLDIFNKKGSSPEIQDKQELNPSH